jgi:hypothetical protein
MPAANEDRLTLTLDPLPLLLPAAEIALEVVAVPDCYLPLAVGALSYERALVLELGLFYYALALTETLFEFALVGGSASPGVDPCPGWLA